jgi:hypothetical protein
MRQVLMFKHNYDEYSLIRMKWKQSFSQAGRLTFDLRGDVFIGRFVTDRKFRYV